MLTKKQIQEIRDHLDLAQNPLFLFDNDVDGLCSFLLLQKYSGKGKGFPIKSYPDLTLDYFRKVHELGCDYIFILDKPIVSDEFFEEANKFNIPIVWIDHHDNDGKPVPKSVNYYNSLVNIKKKNPLKKNIFAEPTTYLCYQVSQKKEDLWLAVVGSVADKFVPDFYSKFQKEYPELAIKTKDAFEIFYRSGIGKIAQIFSFGIKDRITNVIQMMKFLMKAKYPYQVLEETKENKQMHYRYNYINSKYQKILDRAIEVGKKSDKVLFFKFGGELSMAGDLSNELSFIFPKKIIIAAYSAGIKVNISLRGKNVRTPVLEIIKKLENATGGGHRDAVGATVRTEDIDEFKKYIEKFYNKE
ncbi:DHH family phosphoesterase [Candidatus Pacearchaeota archaeon]|nr:DHH family phosphoesterase [Candidatus Pacearchaeota archaeon]